MNPSSDIVATTTIAPIADLLAEPPEEATLAREETVFNSLVD
jgi:hypothetical protein